MIIFDFNYNTWGIFPVFQRYVWHLQKAPLILLSFTEGISPAGFIFCGMRRDRTALLCAEPWPLQPVKCLSSQLACLTLRALRWQRVKWYLNYFRIQILQNLKPLCAHICCTTFAAHSRQSAKQPIAHGNTNKGCQKISVQRSVVNDRHQSVVLSLFWKIIGLDFDQELFFIPSSH